MSRSESQAEQNLGHLVREQTSAALRHAAATAKRMSIELSELAALEHLQGAGPMTLGKLGQRLSMSPGAVTALVDRLEVRGYAERIPNPEDRRSMLVRVTRKGVDGSLDHLWPYIEEMKRIEEGFTEEERAVIARFLTAAAEATHRHARGSG